MADLGVPKEQFLVSPTVEIEKKWLEASIQEKISRIARFKQDIEDLVKGQIKQTEAKIMMLEREVTFLQDKLTKLTPIDA